MKVTGLDGRRYTMQLKGAPHSDEKSSYHLRARALLEKVFPLESRLEEVSLPGCGNRTLYADFLLPLSKLIVEVQGEQHYKYNEHMHGHRTGFVNSLVRDQSKRDWAELNGFSYVELRFDESDREWRDRIRSAFNN